MCPAFLPANNCDRTRQYSTKPLDTEIGFYPMELCVDINFGDYESYKLVKSNKKVSH